MLAHRHGQHKFQHGQPDGRGIDEAPASEDEVGEGPLAGVAWGKALMRVLVVPAQCAKVRGAAGKALTGSRGKQAGSRGSSLNVGCRGLGCLNGGRQAACCGRQGPKVCKGCSSRMISDRTASFMAWWHSSEGMHIQEPHPCLLLGWPCWCL